MAKFETKLIAEEIDPISDRTQWRLHHDLVFASDLIGLVVVPAGFETDFASVPRLPLTWLLAGGVANDAAVVHDWLCVKQPYTSGIAARVFLEAMKSLGISAWRRVAMYLAVKFFGPKW